MSPEGNFQKTPELVKEFLSWQKKITSWLSSSKTMCICCHSLWIWPTSNRKRSQYLSRSTTQSPEISTCPQPSECSLLDPWATALALSEAEWINAGAKKKVLLVRCFTPSQPAPSKLQTLSQNPSRQVNIWFLFSNISVEAVWALWSVACWAVCGQM